MADNIKKELINPDEDIILQEVRVETPWFKLWLDRITWKEVLVLAMVLVAVVYIIKG